MVCSSRSWGIVCLALVRLLPAPRGQFIWEYMASPSSLASFSTKGDCHSHTSNIEPERWHLSWFQLSLQLIYFRYGSNTCSHCVEEWQKPIRYGTLHFQDRCAAQLRSLREITVLMCAQEPIRQNFRIGTRTAFWYSVNFNQILLPMVLRCPRFSRTRTRNSNRAK